jgi:hypothetical protein
VAAYLVPRIRDVPPKSSTLTGGVASTYIQYLTKPKAFSQIFAVSKIANAACEPFAPVAEVKACWGLWGE